ncbi:histidinol-phosphate aminotransferase [Oceanospirillum multiglobuliferum]|uniref:Histidinol-phosphate aminotransferase n=1 Tax=Oceanospirillum multiglobuliferum TaxID=64969 RepID=A0A1T4KP25_9GAMM|nr:histidinol-phosphate transaminase [Oceanospirillum multiglobuliferum]OPX56090.1 histidinol-phosphate transaminase [Oceanospirillum multiglobuliferum]SJZ44151.1 histidinol-phosphate aminotransferase [Oceanospirillum multiglobuliferum]
MACDFIELANKGVQGLQPYQPGKPVEELERELGISNIVKLASNENPLGPSPKALAAIEKVLPELTRYPDGAGFRLRSAIAEQLGVAANQVTLGNGSNDVLELIARAYLTGHSASLYSQHAFAVYPIVTQAIGAQHIVVPAKNWGHDLEAMAAAITEKTRVIFIANPNNPTGTWLTETEVRAFLDQVPERIIVVLDEAYTEYVSEAEFPNGITLLNDYPNLVVTRTFSKAYGLAGLRVGYSVSNPQVADILNRIRQPFNVNMMAQEAAIAALADTDYLRKGVELNQQGMAYLESEFKRLGLSYIPSVGNFVCVDVGRPAGPVDQALLHEGVIVRPVGAYQMPNHLRISIGTMAENQRFIEALEKVLG